MTTNTPPQISIIINCPRTNSNLLQIIVGTEGLHLYFLAEDERRIVGGREFMPYAEYPELRDVARVTTFDVIWDADLLWSLATLNEDHAVTPLGHYALHNDDCWQAATLPDQVNGSDEAVAV